MASVRLFLLALVVVVLAATTTATADPAKPVIPAQLVSTVDVSLKGGIMEFVNATFMFDSIAKATSIKNLWSLVPDSPQYGLNVTAYSVTGALFYVNNGVCRQYPGGFDNMFAFVQSPLAKYGGSVTVRGRVCDLWTLKTGPFSLGLASQGNLPVQLNWTVSTDGVQSSTSFYFYPDLSATAPPPALLVPPRRCYGPGFMCPHGTVANITMVRYHTTDNWALTNKNTADALGDAVFICTTLATSTHSYDELISLFEVQVNTSWTRYGKCNGGVCFGSAPFGVGRGASWTASNPPGQCTTNYLFGTWYSMTQSAACNGSQSVGAACAWKVLERIKTINGTCMLETVGPACKGATFPYSDATRALKKAIATCPGVQPPPSLKRDDTVAYLDDDSALEPPPVAQGRNWLQLSAADLALGSALGISLDFVSWFEFGLYTELTVPGV